jgi:hypothetical protein
MSVALNNLMVNSGDTMYHSADFLNYAHTHKAYLKANSMATPLDPGIVHKFEYNFISLLVELAYPIEDLMLLMVVNDIVCPTQMTQDFKEILIPDPSAVSQLKALYRQTPGRI